MKWLAAFAARKQSMKRKLLAYMVILVTLVLTLLLSGLLLLGQFTGAKQRTFEILDFQANVFHRQLESHFEGLAVMGIQLSVDAADAIEAYLSENQMDFAAINDSEKHIAAIQKATFDMLSQKLFEAKCSGAFIVLDATVNTDVDAAAGSRTGLYLQRSSLDYSDTGILLYRGLTQLGKEHGVMPHRKWRLEFNADLFPNYAKLIAGAQLPLAGACRISDIFTLAGTSERAVLMTLPIIGSDGTAYGLCGFEISESYFRHTFNQPSKLEHAVFTVSKGSEGVIDHADSFSCGIRDGYYLSPKGAYRSSSFGNGLTLFRGDISSYIGVTKQVNFWRGSEAFFLTTLIPKQDYDGWILKDAVRIVLLVLLILAATVGCSYFFTSRYLTPIKKSLEQLKQKEYDRHSGISEIDDLFAFLAQQDRISEAAFDAMRREKADMQTSLERIRNVHNETVQQVERLAYSRKDEVDPCDYEDFKNGLKFLTEREKEILDLYIAGNTVKEIVALTGLRESTIRFHNRNIYTKLNVHSLKQLLRYFAIMKQEGREGEEKGIGRQAESGHIRTQQSLTADEVLL